MRVKVVGNVAYIIFRGEIIHRCSPEIAERVVIDLIIAMGLSL